MSDMERRNNDRRTMVREDTQKMPGTTRPETSRPDTTQPDRESMRNNPEVMGRSEPSAIPARPRTAETWPEMDDVRMQFERLQSEFIDDPRRAVEKAEHLMDDMFNKMREHVQRIHRDVEKNGDTEHLRLAMRGYREMIGSFGTTRAA